MLRNIVDMGEGSSYEDWYQRLYASTTRVVEVAEARLKLAQPSFGDPRLKLGRLKPPRPKVGRLLVICQN